MKRFLTRASVAGLSAALVAGAALVAAPAASAAPIGSLTFFSGVNDGIFNNQDDTFSFQTDGACPTSPTNSTNFLIRVSGPGLPAAPATLANIQGNTAGSTVGGITSGSFSGPVQFTLSNFAANQAQPGGYLGAGTYTLELVCRTALQSASLGEFVGQLQITGSGASSVVSPVLASVATTTTIAGPTTGTTSSTPTYTASVSPTNAVGAVQFKRDGVNIGAPVPVVAGEATSPAVGPLAAGSYVISANFVGGSNASSTFTDSQASTTLTIAAAPAEPTTTGLGLSASSVANGSPVTATATVTKTADGSNVGSGSVQFKVDGTNYGAPVPVTAGVATINILKGAGTYSVTADFLGTAAFLASGSPAATFDVSGAPPALSTDPQYIQVEVPAGVITIDTPYTGTNPLQMGVMTLNGVAGYSATANFSNITVADTRAGNTAWTAQALSSDFTKGAAGPTETISANNVGLVLTTFTTNAADPSAIGGLPAGSAPSATENFSLFNNPAGQYLPYNNVGTQGLGGIAPHAVMHANNGLGTTETSGNLTVTAPTSVTAGLYTGIITFTVVGS